MTDKMFAFMSRLVSISASDGRFDLSAARISDVDLPHLQEAQYHKWVVIKSYDSRITKEGFDAYLAEKEKRDSCAEEAAKKSKGRMKSKMLEVATAILVAVLASIAGVVVAHWLQ